MSHLLEFYGEECPSCIAMTVLVQKLKDEKGITTERFEVWHNEENMKKLEAFDKDLCGGVPFFMNTKTGKWICGEVPYKQFLAWAEGK